MRKRLIPVLGVAVGAVAAATGLLAARSEATVRATTVPVDAAITLRRGESRVLYSPRGRFGAIGRFRVACTASPTGAASYTKARTAADTVAAVSGRGVSRARVLRSSAPTLRGGSVTGGIERWLLRMGREPEDVLVDVSLVAIRRPEAPGSCEFWLLGSVTITPR